MRLFSVVVSCVLPAALAVPVAAQCTLLPVPSGTGVPSLDGPAYTSTRWDPDGSGPSPERLVVGGQFTLAGDVTAAHVAAFDPATNQWSSLGSLGSSPTALAVLTNGTLLVSDYTMGLRQWNGTAWVAFAVPPPAGIVTAFAAAPNGDVLLATRLSNTVNMHRFIGGSWQAIGSAAFAFNPPEIRVIAVAANGDVVVGGLFTAVSGVAAASIARWNGSVWSSLGAGIDGRVHSLAFASNGDVVAGGHFPTASGIAVANIARWNGGVWSSLGSGTSSSFPPSGVVYALLAQPNGDVIAGGEFDVAGGVPAAKVARWNGTAWSAMGTGIDPVSPVGDTSSVHTLAAVGGEVFAGGPFVRVGGRDSTGLARWNGAVWGPMRAAGIGNVVSTVHVARSGDVYIGGAFRDIDGVACNGIARRAGNTWQPLGTGLATPGAYAGVQAIAEDRNGDLVVGGYFATAGGVASPTIARWNGSSWLPLGTGLAGRPGSPPAVYSMFAAANGDLWIAGDFVSAGGVAAEGIAKWDGAVWSTLPPGLVTSSVGFSILDAVAVMPNGDVVVTGVFDLGGGFSETLARWNGASWQVLGGFDSGVRSLLPLPGGDLLVGGGFSLVFGAQSFPGLARWSNGSWFAVGAPAIGGSVQQLARLPGGDFVAAGWLSFGNEVVGLARCDGTNWIALADSPPVFDMAVDPRGELVIAGFFTSFAATASAYFGRFATPCPATAVAAGTGCVGSGGANVLATSSLPWLGATFESTATGLPANGLALAVLGLATASTPLAAILSQGGPGCVLLATPDLLTALVPSGNSLAIGLPLPPALSLVGVVLHQQVVPLELGAGGAITALTATNRLTLVLGAF
jgi:trimeric autotransporter adhesin